MSRVWYMQLIRTSTPDSASSGLAASPNLTYPRLAAMPNLIPNVKKYGLAPGTTDNTQQKITNGRKTLLRP